MTIGELVKQFRQSQNLSQREFAIKCGLSNGIISLIEKGKNPKTNEAITPTLPTLNSIAKGMGLKIDDLLEKLDDFDISLSRTSNVSRNSKTAEFIKLFENLSSENQMLVINIMKGILSGDK